MKFSTKHKKIIIDLIGIFTFALILANISIEGCVTSLSDLAPIDRELDFKSSDFYQLVADARSEKVLDEQIVIIPIDKLSRKDICHLIEDVTLCNPRAIGLDVFFTFPMEDDAHLLKVLQNTPGLVVAMGVSQENSDNCRVDRPYLLDSLQNSLCGIVNMNVKRRYNVVRDFIPYYQTERGIIDHFSLALARHVDPSVAEHFLSSYNKHPQSAVSIDYPSREFEVIEPDDILEHIDELEGKVIMIGALHDTQDIFVTPINDAMAGIMVHAYTLSTILGERSARVLPQWILWIFGLLICIIFIIVKMWLKRYSIENLLMRFFQILIMFAITYGGCYLYIKHHYVLELSMPLMLTALGIAALDIWDDIVHITPKLFAFMKQHLFSRFHLLCFFLLLSGSIQAATYQVYKVDGDVRILKNGNWEIPQKHQELSIRDQFLIGEHGSLGIVVNETHRIYYTVHSGKQNVAQIISAARKQSDHIASNMSKQLTANKQMKGSSLPVYGGVNRGNHKEVSSTDLVYATIYNFLQKHEQVIPTPVNGDIVYSGDSYYFKAFNHTNRPLYANVVRLPLTTGEQPQICMEVGYTMNEPFLVIGAGQETNWSDFTFLVEETQHQYLLFASEEPYDCQALQMMLRTLSPPSTVSGKHPVVHLSLIK